MAEVVYPFDASGVLASNLVEQELHTTTEANFRDYRFIIPNFAPFFAEGLKVRYKSDDGTVTELTNGLDFQEVLPYVSASRSLGKMVYGGISISNKVLDGIVSIDYQTVGGEWICDTSYVLEILAEKVYNPRLTIWDNVTNVQTTFPTVEHYQGYDSVYGQEYVIDALNSIAAQIAAGYDSSDNKVLPYLKHNNDKENPHEVSKDQVDLGNVENYGVATQDEVVAITAVDKYVTPFSLKTLVTTIFTKISTAVQSVIDLTTLFDQHKLSTDAHGLGNLKQRVSNLEVTVDVVGDLSTATSDQAGLMTAADKAKLDGIAEGATANTGTVTSVGLTLPSFFSVTNSPVTTSGTLTASLANQTINKVLAAPTTATGTPTFRLLVAGDIPNLDWAKITSGKPTTLSGYGITDGTPSAHVGSTGAAHGQASSLVDGFMSSSDKAKVDTTVTNTAISKGTIASGSTVTFTVTDGFQQEFTATSGNVTLAFTGWLSSGIATNLLLKINNAGLATLTFPTIYWVMPDGSHTTSASSHLSGLGRTLSSSSPTWFAIWTSDGGTTLFGKIV